MHREEMLKMLHEIDAELTLPLEIGIAGASALVLNGSISRTTSDLDIYKATPDITQFQEIIDKLALKNHLNNNWIDTRVSDMISKYLPEYEIDSERVEGDFKFLKPYIISKVDCVITKLHGV